MAEAQLEYALVLWRGLGLTRDEPKAIPYLKSAAQKGLAAAQNRLAHVYVEGVGVEKDKQEAAKWRLIAKAGGMQDPELDAKRFRRTEAGICLVTKPMIERLSY